MVKPKFNHFYKLLKLRSIKLAWVFGQPETFSELKQVFLPFLVFLWCITGLFSTSYFTSTEAKQLDKCEATDL